MSDDANDHALQQRQMAFSTKGGTENGQAASSFYEPCITGGWYINK